MADQIVITEKTSQAKDVRAAIGSRYGNKAIAQKLGARYGAGGWYAPPGVDLAAFRERGWL